MKSVRRADVYQRREFEYSIRALVKLSRVVPVSLHLTNFLSYASPAAPLDFTGFQTACLCGNNGHGKSALLDALTWAMWGKARMQTPQLLRIGAGEMRVEFVFDLDGERYRIVRGWTKNKRGGTPLLEFNVADAQSGLFRALTSSSTTETQTILNNLLRMDYETFINSAYLKQGMADVFSRQMPGQRKQILAEILGLSRYQEIAEQARTEMRQKDTIVAQLEGQIEAIEKYLSGREEAQRSHDFYDDALKKLRPKIDRLDEQIRELNARKVRLDESRKRAESIAGEVALETRKRDELLKARGKLLAQQAELEEWQAQSTIIIENYDHFRAAEEERRKWEAVKDKYDALGESYRALNERVREMSRHLEAQRSDLQTQLAHHNRVLESAQNKVAGASEVQKGAQELQSAREEEARLGEQRAAFDRATRQLDEAQNALRAARNSLDVELHKTQNQIAELEQIAARKENAYRVLESARAQVEKLHQAQKIVDESQEERLQIQARIEQLKQQVEAGKAETAAQEQKLRVLLANPQAQCPLCETSLGEHGREHIQENIEDEILKLKDLIEEYTQEARLLKKKKDALDEPANAARAVLNLAQKYHAQEANAKAETERIEDAARRLQPLCKEAATLQAQIESGDFAPELQSRLKSSQADLANIEYSNQAHEAAARRVRELSRFEREIAAVRLAEEQIADAQGHIADLEPRLQSIESDLESGEYARDERRELARLKAQAEALGFDGAAKDALRTARETSERLQNATARYEKYKSVLSRCGDLENDLAQSVRVLEEHEERLRNLQRESDALRNVAAEMTTCERSLREYGTEIDEARQNELELSAALGGQINFLEECNRRDAERIQLDERRKDAQREAFILKRTSEAFGKDGIQALIIENAIPEIQDDANTILRRLTHNTMQISLESQREKQSGGTRETLDIKISDDRGTREYGLFSGGEAFRADFALRIALSKLLARRAGTQLRTLIIDEGFGTQDSDGLQQMIECIQAISDDFSKVLVVTHMDAIKNAFPTRIEIVKEPDTGSSYQVISS